MAVLSYLKSTILSKVVMAATGIILLLFIVGHMLGNMQVFLGAETFNHYAQFLQGLGEFLWIIRLVLIFSLILHIITSVYLNFLNNAAKPIKYQVKRYVSAKLTSRTMIWTGIMIFAFLSYHLLHFTMGVTNPEDYNYHEYYEGNSFVVEDDAQGAALENIENSGKEKQEVISERHDVYKMVVLGFRNPYISLAYIVGVVLLGFHLSHAIQSAFQTLGVTGQKFTPRMVTASIWFSVIIVILYISIPISIFLGLVGGKV